MKKILAVLVSMFVLVGIAQASSTSTLTSCFDGTTYWVTATNVTHYAETWRLLHGNVNTPGGDDFIYFPTLIRSSATEAAPYGGTWQLQWKDSSGIWNSSWTYTLSTTTCK